MLQQTQVKTVVDYFCRFVHTFPTVESLSAADEQAVLRLWQGLGYYRRARLLHATARKVIADFDGQIPNDAGVLQTLPGVGRYTAGAIASIAYGQREPIVDGNVARVLARWCAIDSPIDETETKRLLWQLADRIVSPSNPGDFNQALMELGSVVCTPKQPQCLLCPVAKWCQAQDQGISAQLPKRLPKPAPRPVAHHVAAIVRRGRYFFEQRGNQGLWSHMWQLPTREDLAKRPHPLTIHQWLCQHLKLDTTTPKTLGSFTHQTSHRHITFTVWQAQARGAWRRRGGGLWRRLDQITDLPLANAQRQAVAMLRDAPGTGGQHDCKGAAQ